MREPLCVPYLPNEDIWKAARDFLQQTHAENSIPIPIERMVESLKIDIVPMRGLQRTFQMEGCTSRDRSTIYVDEWVANHREPRYRFTLAHEVGHIRLHPQIFERLQDEASTPEKWRGFFARLPEPDQLKIEFQAYAFAGLVLVPPQHLVHEYDRVAPGVRQMMRASSLEDVPREKVLEIAWEKLTAMISPAFNVSNAVIRRRLKFDGFKPEDL